VSDLMTFQVTTRQARTLSQIGPRTAPVVAKPIPRSTARAYCIVDVIAWPARRIADLSLLRGPALAARRGSA